VARQRQEMCTLMCCNEYPASFVNRDKYDYALLYIQVYSLDGTYFVQYASLFARLGQLSLRDVHEVGDTFSSRGDSPGVEELHCIKVIGQFRQVCSETLDMSLTSNM